MESNERMQPVTIFQFKAAHVTSLGWINPNETSAILAGGEGNPEAANGAFLTRTTDGKSHYFTVLPKPQPPRIQPDGLLRALNALELQYTLADQVSRRLAHDIAKHDRSPFWRWMYFYLPFIVAYFVIGCAL